VSGCITDQELGLSNQIKSLFESGKSRTHRHTHAYTKHNIQ